MWLSLLWKMPDWGSVPEAPNVFFPEMFDQNFFFFPAFMLELAVCTCTRFVAFPAGCKQGQICCPQSSPPSKTKCWSDTRGDGGGGILPACTWTLWCSHIATAQSSFRDLRGHPCGIPQTLVEKQGPAMHSVPCDIGFPPVHYVPRTVLFSVAALWDTTVPSPMKRETLVLEEE